MLIAVTRVQIPKEQQGHLATAFRRGAQDLKQFPGFLGFELWQNDTTLEAVSRWESRQAMDAYAQSDLFRAHHGRSGGNQPPAGQIEYFEGEVVT